VQEDMLKQLHSSGRMASGQELFSVAEGPPDNLEGLKYILKEHLSTLELVSMITSQNFLMINDDSNVG
jgi:hypothetical protein